MVELQNKLVEIITQLQSIVKDNAADAVNLGLSAIKVEGFSYILLGALCLLGSLILLSISYKIWKKWDAEGVTWTQGENYSTYFIIAFVPACALFIFGTLIITYVWNWVAIFEPKLWLAHQVIAKLG